MEGVEQEMRPLEGVKVVEAAGYISIPFGAMALADLGAEVIKVEPPRGETYRHFGPQYGNSSLAFKAVNQNKQARFIDLKDPAGLAELKDLLGDADVFMTNWRPSVAPSLGITDELIRSEFPNLIWVRVSGYGPTGPMADMPAYDGIVQARSGLMRMDPGEPLVPTNLLADKVSAMTAAQTATAALLARHRTGQGSICDISMLDALAYFAGADISAGHRIVEGDPDERVYGQVRGSAPLPTSDGWITLSPVTGRQLRACLAATGFADDWDEILADGKANIWTNCVARFGPRLTEETTEFWEQAFAEADVPAGAVMTLGQHMEDAQTVHNGTYEVTYEPGVGQYRRVQYPAWFDGARPETAGLISPQL